MQTLGDSETQNPSELEESDDDEELEEIDHDEGQVRVTPAQPPRTSSARVMFEIDPNINIHSKALLDMIAETEAGIEKEVAGPSTGRPATSEKRISVAEAFENW